MSIDHPALQQFRGKLASRQVTQLDAEGFDKWRNRENKCPPGSELKQAADALWAEFEAKGGTASCVSITRGNPAAAPAPGPGGRRPFDGGARPQYGGPRPGQPGGHPQTRVDTNNADAGSPACIGEPFHNPYTFLPFPPADWFSGVRARRQPTPLSMDEIETGRFTGVIDIEVHTLSPLLTCNPEPTSGDAPHKTYSALTIGDDVIVPATGVRGSLRNLMSILAGGTLGYLDESAWLVQGRDLPLGPRGKNSPPETPACCFLAEVASPGTETRDGRLRLGKTRLIKLEALEKLAAGRGLPRPQSGRRAEYLWLDERDESIRDTPDARHVWKLKLSGRPINMKGKREGLFKADGREITVRKDLWAAYLGRNRHGDHPELRQGDLVWLEPANANVTAINSEKDIASIQWARWGRKGEQLLKAIDQYHHHLLPDSMNADGQVDEVTDLFGQVPLDGLKGPAGPFAARVRPENLVFRDAARDGLERGVALAPLAPPHPGCAPFYRATADPDSVTNRGPLRGLKVYRTTRERGTVAPWLFSTQGVYNERGGIMDAHQKVNKTCDLLKEGRTGTLRLACRSLSDRELALVLLACSVDWRLGGGKPLGLGACRPTEVVVRDETGAELHRMTRMIEAPAELPANLAAEVADLTERRVMWHAVMQPVDKLRYPRTVDMNRNRIQRGGHVWFARHANPKKGGGDGTPVGLEVLWADGELKQKAGTTRVAAQPLPDFDPAHPQADCLYGYDLFAGESDEWIWRAGNRQTYHKKLEAFDPARHATGQEKSGGFQGQNRDHRQAGRQDARRGHGMD